MFGEANAVMTAEGLRGLWRGVLPSLYRTFAGSVMIPFTVVKTRIESGAFQYRSVFPALESILRNEGLRGLTRGLGPTLARDVPFSSLYLA